MHKQLSFQSINCADISIIFGEQKSSQQEFLSREHLPCCNDKIMEMLWLSNPNQISYSLIGISFRFNWRNFNKKKPTQISCNNQQQSKSFELLQEARKSKGIVSCVGNDDGFSPHKCHLELDDGHEERLRWQFKKEGIYFHPSLLVFTYIFVIRLLWQFAKPTKRTLEFE